MGISWIYLDSHCEPSRLQRGQLKSEHGKAAGNRQGSPYAAEEPNAEDQTILGSSDLGEPSHPRKILQEALHCGCSEITRYS